MDGAEMHTAEAPRRKRLALFVFLAAGAVAVLAMVSFAFSQRQSGVGPRPMPTTSTPIAVATVTPEFVDQLVVSDSFSGQVVARRAARVGFDRPGRIARMAVDIGAEVRAGQVLAELDTRSLTAQIAAADAQVREAEAALALAESTVSRQQQLFERGFVSGQRLDEARASADASRARVGAVKASADALRVERDLHQLRAPFAGVVSHRLADEGQAAAPGAPVLEISEAGPKEAHLGLPPEVAARLVVGEAYPLLPAGSLGQAATAEGSIADPSATGVFKATSGTVDPVRRTVTAVFSLPETSSLLPGALVRLEAPATTDVAGFWIPMAGLLEAERGLWSVYVARPNDRGSYTLERRLVEIVHAEARRAFVRGAIEPGERVVSTGLQRLVPNMIVTLEG
jgi:RND family efflux transporter MFP subunit